MALLVNRRALVDGLLDTKSDPGNDSPFAPVFPSTAEVEQRHQDVRKAKELLAAAGQEDGFRVQLAGWNGFEMPDLAQLIQQDVRQAGHHDRPQHHRRDQLLRRGDVRQLALARLRDGDHRVRAPRRAERPARRAAALQGDVERRALQEREVRRRSSRTTSRRVDLADQRRYAKQIQELLLDESPILFTYFYYYLTGAKNDIAGLDVTAMGHYDLSRTGRVVLDGPLHRQARRARA